MIFVVKAAIIFFTYLFIENTYNEVQDFIIYRRLKKEIERKKLERKCFFKKITIKLVK